MQSQIGLKGAKTATGKGLGRLGSNAGSGTQRPEAENKVRTRQGLNLKGQGLTRPCQARFVVVISFTTPEIDVAQPEEYVPAASAI